MYGGKPKEIAEVEAGGMRRLLVIVVISALVIWVGAGCKSLPGTLEIDTPFFDIEYKGGKTE